MTLAAITMTAPEAASPVQMYRATYSPDDNKLRLYAASRLDPETYKKVHDAGFRWAPKQALFVAPAWTPGREDVLLSLAGEIEDEDSTLAERQEARAERFTGYSGNPRWSCRSTAASRRGRQSRKPVRTRRWSLRLKSNWHSIRRKQSEAGMHAGVTGWQSMTWKPCSGSGASVFRHWPEWNAGSGRICRSGRLLRKPVLQQERPVTLSVRWSGGWCRTNSGRQRDAATITRISRERSE